MYIDIFYRKKRAPGSRVEISVSCCEFGDVSSNWKELLHLNLPDGMLILCGVSLV